jgi:Patatin-like phospholipase
MSKFLRPLVIAVSAILMNGCCTERTVSGTAGLATKVYQLPSDGSFTDSLRKAFSTSNPKSDLNILVLSGGGSHGAWGAGVLTGWRQNNRPIFQIVTGVSTGALLATYAFLDDPNLDTPLRDAYVTAHTADIYTKRWLVEVPFSDSLNTASPLYSRICKYLPDSLIDRVGAANASERRMYVGTANLDTGTFVIWDMTHVAADHQYDLYRNIIFASASIPIWVPPVDIDGHLYGDGGVREQLFMSKGFFNAVKQMRTKMGHNVKPKINIYTIIDGKIGMDSLSQLNNCLIPVAGRTLDMILDSAEVGSLYRLEYLSDKYDTDTHQFISRIPNGLTIISSYEFDPIKLGSLYEAGFNFGKNGVWETQIYDIDPDPILSE